MAHIKPPVSPGWPNSAKCFGINVRTLPFKQGVVGSIPTRPTNPPINPSIGFACSMSVRRAVAHAAVLALVLAVARPSSGQATGGVLEGRVTDEQQRAVIGAAVTARHGETGL